MKSIQISYFFLILSDFIHTSTNSPVYTHLHPSIMIKMDLFYAANIIFQHKLYEIKPKRSCLLNSERSNNFASCHGEHFMKVRRLHENTTDSKYIKIRN